MSNEFNEEVQDTNESVEAEQKYAFKNVIKKNPNKRTWSVVSIVLACLSLVSVILPPISIILGILAIGAAILSRVNLGYFDKLSLAGLIISIFGVVFSTCGIIFFSVFASQLAVLFG